MKDTPLKKRQFLYKGKKFAGPKHVLIGGFTYKYNVIIIMGQQMNEDFVGSMVLFGPEL